MSLEIPHLIRWNALQLQGRRARQEDAIRANQHIAASLVFALADGLGGHSCGDEASRVAADEAVNQLLARETSDDPDASSWRSLFGGVHAAVRRIPNNWEGFGPPASTLIADQLNRDGACWLAAVGDSSAWRIQADDTVIRLFGRYRSGTTVRAAVGDSSYEGAAVEILAFALQPGDRLVLASDGIDSLSEDRIHEALRVPFDHVLPNLATAIAQRDFERQDNLTVLVIHLLDCKVC